MTTYMLSFTLESDATFGRGDGIPGLVEREIVHDANGFPYLPGKRIKGMLAEECDGLLELLNGLRPGELSIFEAARNWMFGQPGSRIRSQGALIFGQAQFPENLRKAVIGGKMQPDEVLRSLTTIRRQSAIDVFSEAPESHTLRATRVVIRQTPFKAVIETPRALTKLELALLSASVLHWHRAGSIRNRGRGRLIADLIGPDGEPVLANGIKLLEVQA